MSKDIRSFFKPINKTSSSSSKSVAASPIKDAAKGKKKRPHVIVESDSEDEIFESSSKKKKASPIKASKKKSPVKEEPKKSPVKQVNLESFFGNAPIQQKPQVITNSVEKKKVEPVKIEKKSKKKKKGKESKPADDLWMNDDDDDLAFVEIDEEKLNASINEKTPNQTPQKSEKTPRQTPQRPEIINNSNKTNGNDKTEKHAKPNVVQTGSLIVVKASPSKKPSSQPIKLEEMNSEKKTKKGAASKVGSSIMIIEKRTPDKKPPPHPTKSEELNSEQKKKNSEAYQRFLQRGGPRNPGSKPIPKGSSTCLQGKTFVISGVLESMEREEAAELVKKCGGKVTSSVSKKTSYIVLGEEPGVSKLDKAIKFGVPQLSEDDLLDLIRTRSGETIECDSSQDSVISETPPKKMKREEERTNVETNKRRKIDLEPEKGTVKIESIEELNTKPQVINKVKIKKENESLNKKMEVGRNMTHDKDSGIGSSQSSQFDSDSLPALAEVQTITLGDSLWVDKYKPKTTKSIIGQAGDRSCVKKLTYWLQNWEKFHSKNASKKPVRPAPWSQNDDGSFYKAALLSGPPGVGKTTTAHLVCQELGYDVVEFNASDTRSKRLLHEEVSELLSSKSIKGFFQKNKEMSSKHVLLMDEVDGMAGNEDRGGIQELIQLIKHSQIPVICMCNDRQHPKMRTLSNYTFDLKFSKPRVEQIKAAMMSICFKEGIKISGDSLCEMITNSNHDIRQVLHNLSLWAVSDKSLTTQQVKVDSEKAKKVLKLGPWDVARSVFSASDHEKMSIHDKCDLFFQDYSLGPLFVQDTYLRVRPKASQGDKKKTLQLISAAADSMCWGDAVERAVRSKNAWNLLPTQAIFSSVIPGHKMAGHVSGQIQFPVWLGKNSKKNKMDRMLQELQVHMRLTASGTKLAVNLDYRCPLADAITKPLIQNGVDGVPEALHILHHYNLLREDLDNLSELCEWSGRKPIMADIEPKVKAALTRAYNKEGKATPYAAVVAVKKNSRTAGASEELYEEDEEVSSPEDEDDITTDAMIKKGKNKPAKPEKKISKDEPSTSKGKGAKTKKVSKK